MRIAIGFGFLFVVLAAPGAGSGTQKVELNPKASLIDVAARRAEIEEHPGDRVRRAVAELGVCGRMPAIAAPRGPMRIPMHYLHGSHGPTNPAEAAATRVYNGFERRVTAGMNRYIATGDDAGAQCAQDQMDTWARAGALLDYDAQRDPQSWYQTEWTLSAIAISESVLVSDGRLDGAEMARDIAWMNEVAHHLIGFEDEHKDLNNHHYWRGLAAIATGVISRDGSLFGFGVEAYRDAVDEIDARGALPLEMARSERSIHYQDFALQPLVAIAEFAERQGVPLYEYKSASGKTIADAIDFLGAAVADPAVVRVYTRDAQLVEADSTDFFAPFEFYRHRFPQRTLPPAIVDGLKKPTFATRLGGSTTVLAGR